MGLKEGLKKRDRRLWLSTTFYAMKLSGAQKNKKYLVEKVQEVSLAYLND